MNQTEDKDFVFCTECLKKGKTGSQCERAQREELQEDVIKRGWICDNCADKKIRLQVLHFIANRIQATQTVPRDKYKFIFRELLQNADDVKANILVLRFEEDALYVANDGRAFTVRSCGNMKSDFDRLSQILGRHQEEDKEVVGHFGSGFQTVYAITNYPEVYSSGRHGRMNPCDEKWTWGIKSPHPHFNKSPYWRRKDNKGVLFRLPWRDDAAATEEVEGEKVWEDKNKWPRWDKQERRRMFDDLKSYILQAILCCQHLKAVRLVWQEKGRCEAFQVLRDFCLRNEDTETLGMSCVKGSVQQGSIEFEEAKDKYRWEDSFQFEDGYHWASDSQSFHYLIGQNNASEDGKRLFLGKRNSLAAVTTDRGVLERELERGDLSVVLPLFDVCSVFEQDGLAYLYSVIPLPGLGKNRFIFSGHFWPTEDRKDVDVEGGSGVYGEWYRSLMLNVVELYEWLFDQFLRELEGIAMPEETRQRIILNSLPATQLSEWMRPGKEDQQEWLSKSRERFDRLLSSLIRKPILFSNGKWIEPARAYWAQDDEEKIVFEIMGAITFTDDFIGHPHFKTFSEILRGRRIDEAKFNTLWSEFVAANHDGSDHLVYCQHLKNGKVLDKRAVDSLIGFCITGKHALVGTLSKVVVPGRDRVLRRLEEYPVLPAQLEFLYDLLPGSNTIHDDFISKELVLVHKEKFRAFEGNQVIFLIDDMVRKDPARFENVSEEDHLGLSKTLRILAEGGWAPIDGLKNCRFIPYKEGSKVSLGTLNVRRAARGGTEWVSSRSTKEHVERYYQRDSIFGVQTLKVSGLTPEVEAKIKFLCLLGCDDEAVEKVEGALNLVKLMAQEDKPLNFVLHFLSPLHDSLFVDFVLESFLGIARERLANQKKRFQEALKVYFKGEHTGEENLTRKDMAKVPCLYDEQENWSNAGDFAQDLEPGMKMLGYKSLHKDLRQWPRDTLYALGVDPSPSCSKIVDTITELAMKKEKHREDLGYIISWLLTSEAPIEAEFENVKDLSWVPTVDCGFKRPQDVLIPSPRNKKILGDDFGGFLDCSNFENKMIDRIEIWQNQKTKERAQLLGLKVEPKLSDMLSVVEAKHKAGTEPPVELFDALSKEVNLDEKRAQDLIWRRNLGYYLNGKWMDSNQIRIMDADNIPKEIRDTLVILPTRHPHAHYLMDDDASDELLPEDILRPLLEKRLSPSTVVWDELRNIANAHPSYFEEEHEKLYGGAPIYPVAEYQVCPKDIICIENDMDDAFLKEGVIGKRYVLGRQLTQSHGEVLKKLGARRGSDLTVNDIIELIRSEKGDKAALNEGDVSSILRLIRRIIALGSEVFPDEALWPAEKSGQIVCMKPVFCYVKDSLLSRYFEKDLSFICLKIDGRVDSSLKDYAITSGSKVLSEYLKREGKIKIENLQEDSQGAIYFKELANALGQHFTSLPNSGCFEWLENVEARRCDNILVQYSIGELKTMVTKAALVERDGSRWVISRVYPSSQTKRSDQLTEDITSICIEQGFPESELGELQFITYRLLTCKPEEWSYYVEEYRQGSPIPHETLPDEPVDVDTIPIQDAFQTLKEVYDLNREEMDELGYADTKNTLQSWYQCCQICGSRTPADEYGYTTNETLKRVVCRRGGRYQGETMGFSADNSVLLCPTHQVLWVRKLVKFSDLENPPEEVIGKLQKFIEDFEKRASGNPQEPVTWECEVFEGKSKRGAGAVKGSWEKREIEFRAEHLLGFLKTIRKYLENKKDLKF